jgi:hypothetical protein
VERERASIDAKGNARVAWRRFTPHLPSLLPAAVHLPLRARRVATRAAAQVGGRRRRVRMCWLAPWRCWRGMVGDTGRLRGLGEGHAPGGFEGRPLSEEGQGLGWECAGCAGVAPSGRKKSPGRGARVVHNNKKQCAFHSSSGGQGCEEEETRVRTRLLSLSLSFSLSGGLAHVRLPLTHPSCPSSTAALPPPPVALPQPRSRRASPSTARTRWQACASSPAPPN